MHKTVAESVALVKELLPGLEGIDGVESIIFPPFTALAHVTDQIQGTSLHLGAQNLYWEEQGAFTGEISPLMLAEIAEYVIIGHSERRAYFNDTDDNVNKKILAALNANLKPILCVGETLEENEAGQTGEVVKRQITAGLKNISEEQMVHMKIAYEPVWAIGTGKAATPEGANQVIKDFIRKPLAEIWPSGIEDKIPVLYGGSVKPLNAREFFVQPDIDGALVGGASLKAEDFIQITKAAA
ncbi:MAG: triose-phosphate isomerase [Anaerolineales bacterium]|nr:triose-phosphate isomerase [Anaerolineales bacterium]